MKVRPSVGLSLARSGGLTRFYGSVKPARDGARVSIQRKTPSGSLEDGQDRDAQGRGHHPLHLLGPPDGAQRGTYRTKLVAAAGYLTGTSRERAASAR